MIHPFFGSPEPESYPGIKILENILILGILGAVSLTEICMTDFMT